MQEITFFIVGAKQREFYTTSGQSPHRDEPPFYLEFHVDRVLRTRSLYCSCSKRDAEIFLNRNIKPEDSGPASPYLTFRVWACFCNGFLDGEGILRKNTYEHGI